MLPRWRVVHGTWGSWLVFRDDIVMSAFLTWESAYRWARQEAIYEGLGIIGLEVTA